MANGFVFSPVGSVIDSKQLSDQEETVEGFSPNHVEEQELSSIPHGIHSTKILRSKFLSLDVVRHVSPIVHTYLMESHNS